ncbi:MAG: hypothetical protein AAF845_15075 [Bacteroidota bacterium]
MHADRLLRAAADAEAVVVGGLAAVLHGASYVTVDLDLCVPREEAGRERLVAAVAPLHPYPRGIEPGLPFVWDARTIRDADLFRLTTEAGDLDLLKHVPGVGDYEAVRARSEEVVVGQTAVRVLSLDALIDAKRAMGRPKDVALLNELEALRALRGA